MAPARALNAVLTERRDIARGLAVFRIEPDGWEIKEFVSGQYVVLGLPGSAPRCAASDPEEESTAFARMLPGVPEPVG